MCKIQFEIVEAIRKDGDVNSANQDTLGIQQKDANNVAVKASVRKIMNAIERVANATAKRTTMDISVTSVR